MKRDEIHDTVIPLLREGTPQQAFPPLLEDSVFVDFRTDTDFFVRLFELVLTIHRIAIDDKMARQHRDKLLSELQSQDKLGPHVKSAAGQPVRRTSSI
jgi:hypothetical protein